MGEGQKTNMNRSLEEEVIPILMGDFEQDFSGEGNNRCGEITATELELEEEPEEDVVELLPSHDKDLIDKVLASYGWAIKLLS